MLLIQNRLPLPTLAESLVGLLPWLIVFLVLWVIIFFTLRYLKPPTNRASHDPVLDDAAVRPAFAALFPDRNSVVQAVFSLRSRFEPCGVIGLGEVRMDNGTLFTSFAVEIPHTGKLRVVSFANQGAGYMLIDTFLVDESDGVQSFAVDNTSIIYRNVRGAELLRRPIHPG